MGVVGVVGVAGVELEMEIETEQKKTNSGPRETKRETKQNGTDRIETKRNKKK